MFASVRTFSTQVAYLDGVRLPSSCLFVYGFHHYCLRLTSAGCLLLFACSLFVTQKQFFYVFCLYYTRLQRNIVIRWSSRTLPPCPKGCQIAQPRRFDRLQCDQPNMERRTKTSRKNVIVFCSLIR